MEKELRISKLKEIQGGEPEMTGVKITYKGDTRAFNVYKIPLDFLIYNKYNGRIGSLVKSHEKEKGEINAENEDGEKLIEKFLWESAKDRNKRTIQSLVENGQKERGIVTSDGKIIDGNRRAFLLRKIFSEKEQWKKRGSNVDRCKYFLAVILPQDADEREIQKLETTYQMGEDEKLDYNNIEKYLKCKDLKDLGEDPSEIAKMMGEEKSKIELWLSTMSQMDNYLSYLGYDGIYTRLNGTEDVFLNLTQSLNRYVPGSKMVNWEYDDTDVNNLTLLCFDYIRARYDTKEFRKIILPSKKDCIFCKSKELWSSFYDEHMNQVEKIEEKTVQELRDDNPSSDLSRLLEDRDKKWETEVINPLTGNLKKHINRLENINKVNEPLELVIKAKETLESVSVETRGFYENRKLLRPEGLTVLGGQLRDLGLGAKRFGEFALLGELG